MYKVTYLDRHGFIVTNDDVIMVFDYYTDPSHALHRELEHNPEKPIVFFVTSYIPKHFDKSIYELAQNHKRMYVMSNDVYPQNVPDKIQVAGMSRGDIIENIYGGLRVNAYATAAKGVAFLVTDKHGKTIFHAGALDDVNKVNEEKQEHTDDQCSTGVAVNRIAEDVKSLDIVFFPCDADINSHSGHHARQFLEEIKVKFLFPIHAGSDEKTEGTYGEYFINGAQVEFLREPGQSIELFKDK